jgi:hypothetical protein
LGDFLLPLMDRANVACQMRRHRELTITLRAFQFLCHVIISVGVTAPLLCYVPPPGVQVSQIVQRSPTISCGMVTETHPRR